MTHTPGPGEICGHERGGCSCGTIWSKPADAPVAEAITKWESGEISKEQMLANARLIASAPTLYEENKLLREALQKILDHDLKKWRTDAEKKDGIVLSYEAGIAQEALTPTPTT